MLGATWTLTRILTAIWIDELGAFMRFLGSALRPGHLSRAGLTLMGWMLSGTVVTAVMLAAVCVPWESPSPSLARFASLSDAEIIRMEAALSEEHQLQIEELRQEQAADFPERRILILNWAQDRVRPEDLEQSDLVSGLPRLMESPVLQRTNQDTLVKNQTLPTGGGETDQAFLTTQAGAYTVGAGDAGHHLACVVKPPPAAQPVDESLADVGGFPPGERSLPEVSKSVYDRFVLDHEVAHCLAFLSNAAVPPGVDYHNFHEALADAYATIHHLQVYGVDSRFPELWADLRSLGGVNRGIFSHSVRAAVLEAAAEARSQGVRLPAISGPERLHRAEAIAARTSLSEKAMWDVLSALDPRSSFSSQDFAVRTGMLVLPSLPSNLENTIVTWVGTHSRNVVAMQLATDYVDSNLELQTMSLGMLQPEPEAHPQVASLLPETGLAPRAPRPPGIGRAVDYAGAQASASVPDDHGARKALLSAGRGKGTDPLSTVLEMADNAGTDAIKATLALRHTTRYTHLRVEMASSVLFQPTIQAGDEGDQGRAYEDAFRHFEAQLMSDSETAHAYLAMRSARAAFYQSWRVAAAAMGRLPMAPKARFAVVQSFDAANAALDDTMAEVPLPPEDVDSTMALRLHAMLADPADIDKTASVH